MFQNSLNSLSDKFSHSDRDSSGTDVILNGLRIEIFIIIISMSSISLSKTSKWLYLF